MKTNLELNLNNPKERQALRAMLDVLDNAPPDGLDIHSGPTDGFDMNRVTCWTSTDGAKLVKDELNANPEVEDVIVKTVNEPESPVKAVATVVDVSKADKKVAKPEEAKKEGPGRKPDARRIDARRIVEAVVGVKIGKGTEVEGTIEEVAETLDGDKIDEQTMVEIRKLQVKLAKYQALDEMKKVIRDVTGIQKGKLADIPAKHGPELIKRLKDVAERVESEGK
jgi:hypothetical protein